ncbi:MAG TPA: hypothetical protein VMH22_11155 [bacterium]|nr:hypothetical protein [bacterium]
MYRLALFALACLLLVNCSVVYVKAPPGKTVTLMSNEPATVKITLRQWSFLWGLIPLNSVNTAAWVSMANLGQLRVKSYYTWYEWLWNIPLFAVVGLHSNTVLLEGNPPPPEQK